jgi:hypothetical protein
VKTELEVRRELREVRKLLKALRAEGEDVDMMYGAQQALIWLLGDGKKPSELEKMIHELAKDDEVVAAILVIDSPQN